MTSMLSATNARRVTPSKDINMPAIRHDPESRAGDRAVRFHRQFHRIQRIAITVDDEALAAITERPSAEIEAVRFPPRTSVPHG